MFDSLPRDATGTREWRWAQFEPYYTDLAERTVDEGTVSAFLSDWTRLSELLDETYSRLYVATTVNTADEGAEELFHGFLDQVYPQAEEAEQKLREKIVAQQKVPPGFEIALRKMRVDMELFRQENLPLKTEEQKLGTQYDKIMGAQTVEWEGKEVTLVQLRPVYQDVDRAKRERAWRTAAQRQVQDREAIGDLWKRFLELRISMAANAGFADYRSFRWQEMHRFDYSPDDCMAFHRAIEETVVPAAERLAEKRRSDLGIDRLFPWDTIVDPLGRPPLAPFKEASELKTGTASLFHGLDPRLGSHFDTMVNEGLLDLENRKNKAPGGYCIDFAAVKRPFIFMNAVGMHDDVQTLLHESGHCFHTFERASLPYFQQRYVGMEFAEVASMAMELLASSHLSKEKGGFYNEADAARAFAEHLERSIQFWPFMAAVDAFQHWVYENPEQAGDLENCDEQWKHVAQRFITWVDWTDLEEELKNGWQTKPHIHVVPFYYVEYGLAQLGAVQIWGNSLKDLDSAVAAYLDALALGGTVPLPDLFARAGAKFTFDVQTLKSAVSLMEHTLESLK
jgi:oligoendopeptidase F